MNWFFFFLASLVNLLPDYSWKKLLNGKIGLCGHFNKKASGYIGSLMSLEIFSCCPQTSPSGVKSLGEPFAPLVGRVSTQFLQIKCHYWSHGRGEDSLFLRHDLSYSVARCDRLWLHTLYPQSASFIPRPLHYWSRIISRQRRGINARWWYLSARRKHGSMESKLAILYFTFGRVAFGFFFFSPRSFAQAAVQVGKSFFCVCVDSGADNEKVPIREVPVSCGERSFWQVSYFHPGCHSQHTARPAKPNHPTARAKHN